jgi:outer membrane cobalamin receptor
MQQPLNVDTTFNTLKNATYANLNAKLGAHRLSFGLRMDYFNYTKDNVFISPRASFSYYINPKSTMVLSAGRYYQSPSYIWLIGDVNQNLNPIQADQIVLAYEHTPMEDLKVQVEIYGKLYSNYPARLFRPQSVLAPGGFDDISLDIPFGLEPLNNDGKGRAYGIELFIQKKLSEIPVYGLLSLSLQKSEFKSLDGIYRASKYDSRFIANLALGWRINPDWELSGKFRLATGVPTTNFTSEGKIDYANYNEGERLPVFHSLDMRIDRRWTFSSLALITYIDIQNIYNRKNVSGIDWNFRESKQELKESSLGILPSIGINLEF